MRPHVVALVTSLAAGLASWPVSLLAVSPQLRSTPVVPDVTARTPPARPSAGLARPSAGGGAPIATWDTFSADVTIRRHLVKKDGSAGPAAPEIKYRWVRTLGETGWKSSFTVMSVAPATIQTSKGPELASMKVPVARIEIGDPRTPTRVLDTEGRLVFMVPSRLNPSEPGADAAVTASVPGDILDRAAAATRSRDWVDQLLPSTAARGARQAALAKELGAREGMVNGLDRFISHGGGATTEVLSDPRWAVPVEINVVRDGALVSHSTLAYAEDPGAGLVRRSVRSEQLLSPESGDRAVIDFELANIRLDRGGAR
jgi:hypothetical protein